MSWRSAVGDQHVEQRPDQRDGVGSVALGLGQLDADHAELEGHASGDGVERGTDPTLRRRQAAVERAGHVGQRGEAEEVDPDRFGPDLGEVADHPAQEARLAVATRAEQGGDPPLHQPVGQVEPELVAAADLLGAQRTLVRKRASFDGAMILHRTEYVRSDPQGARRLLVSGCAALRDAAVPSGADRRHPADGVVERSATAPRSGPRGRPARRRPGPAASSACRCFTTACRLIGRSRARSVAVTGPPSTSRSITCRRVGSAARRRRRRGVGAGRRSRHDAEPGPERRQSRCAPPTCERRRRCADGRRVDARPRRGAPGASR